MVKHYRHGVDEFVLELVSGGIEESDDSPTEGMRRELAEEIGYTGILMIRISSIIASAWRRCFWL